jgi:excinuclease ABC subunit C
VQRPSIPIPDTPGSYQFKDEQGGVIYVGKAINLRSRVGSYFAEPHTLHPRTAKMMSVAASVEWIEVRNEVEALILEYNLIKEHRPRFNIRLRDDKSYPFLAITLDEEWPRAMVMRGRRRKGTKYFGPYVNAWVIRDTLELVLRTFPVRTCSNGVFKQHNRLGRPCLLFHIEKCSGPCVGNVEAEQYSKYVHDLQRFLNGDSDEIVDKIELEMKEASSKQDFERAAVFRDRLSHIHKALERQQMVGDQSENIDVVGIADDEFEASVQVFYVRRGRVMGRNGFILDKVEDVSSGQLMDRILESIYGDAPPLGVPKEVLVSQAPESLSAMEEWLARERGTKVEIRVPTRGDKRELLATVVKNATDEFARHRMKRASDHNSRSRALTELQDLLNLPEAPLRIECYDMAHLQGTDYVGSMVVLEDGLPIKREYRKFKIKDVPGNDDYAAMKEVLTRRLTAYITERDLPVEQRGEKPGKFAYPPQLILVDGGKGQLGVAMEVISELGLEHEIPVASLAKRLEEVFVPNRPEAVDVPRGSDALFMLQVIRDEAHRFANSFHRELRGKRMTKGALDGIQGLGEARKKKLVAHFGTVAAVKKASLDNLLSLGWLPETVARDIYKHLHG